MRRARRLAAVVAAAAAALLAAAWAFGLFSTDAAKPAPAGSALARFRAADTHPAAADGVYTYRTQGSESIDVLGGSRHRYPATTTITAVEVPCGLRLRWDALAHRSTTWTLCTHPRVGLRGVDQRHMFFRQHDRTTYACSSSGAGAFRCRAAHATAVGTVSVVGDATVEVAGARVRALHVRMTAVVSGASHGAETVDWWLGGTRSAPLEVVLSNRTSRKEPLVGDVRYRENATLRLVSTRPQR